MSVASDQIKEYLLAGGLFNPEMMNQTKHDAVRDTLIKARDDIQKLERENAALRKELDWKTERLKLLSNCLHNIDDLVKQAAASIFLDAIGATLKEAQP